MDADNLKNVPSGLDSLKSKEDKLDVDRSKPFPVHFKKLSDVVDNDDAKKTVYNELAKK